MALEDWIKVDLKDIKGTLMKVECIDLEYGMVILEFYDVERQIMIKLVCQENKVYNKKWVVLANSRKSFFEQQCDKMVGISFWYGILSDGDYFGIRLENGREFVTGRDYVHTPELYEQSCGG